MRQVAAVGQVEPHEGIARLEAGEEHGHVGLGAGVRLHVGVLGVEKLAQAVDGQLLDLVDDFAATVVTRSGIAFCVFVGTHAAERLQHLFAHEVFRSNEFDAFALPLFFLADQVGNLDVLFHMDGQIVLFVLYRYNIQR